MVTKAEIRAMRPGAKTCLQPPEMGGFSLTDFLGSAALPAS